MSRLPRRTLDHFSVVPAGRCFCDAYKLKLGISLNQAEENMLTCSSENLRPTICLWLSLRESIWLIV